MVECVTTSSAISKGYLFLCAEQDLARYITVWFPRYRTKILQIIVQHLFSIVLYIYCAIAPKQCGVLFGTCPKPTCLPINSILHHMNTFTTSNVVVHVNIVH